MSHLKHVLTIFLLSSAFLVSSFKVTAQCDSIDFVAGKGVVCAPELVKFFSKKIPPGSSILWNYGAGDVLGKDTGQHIFTAPGTYDITLKVTLSDGVTKCTVTKPAMVTVVPPSKPDFSVSRKVLCSGTDTVTITDKSVGGIGRNWVIDGLSVADTAVQFVHAFSSSGYKDILLILYSQYCPTAYYKVDSAVSVYYPLSVDFEANTPTGCAPAAITFSATNVTAGHTLATYNWSFPGGSPASSTAANPVVTYNTSGSFSVGLSVNNTDGCPAQTFKANYLFLGDTLNFSVNFSKSSACRSEPVSLSITNPGLPGLFSWDLGNGNPQQGSTDKNQIAVFNDTGYQYIKVTRDFGGCKTERVFTKSLYIKPPIARFTLLNPVECDAKSKVYVFNTTKPSVGYTNSYVWNLYDPFGAIEATSTDSIPNFSTSINGKYALELIVNSTNGCSDTLKQSGITRSNPSGSFIAQPATGCIGRPFNLYSTSSQFSSSEPNVHKWTVFNPDGTILYSKNTGILPGVNFTFIDTGTFNALLVVSNSKCRDSIFKYNIIKIVKPTTSFTINDSLPCKNSTINLTATTNPSILPESYVHNWQIEHSGDTSARFKAQGTPAVMAADTPGIYNLRLITQWGNGCADTISKPQYIRVSAPVFTISADKYSECPPFDINAASNIIQNFNFRNPANTTLQYDWFIGPSLGASIANPTAANTQVTFNATEAYTLGLRVQNASGCIDSAYLPVQVLSGVIANFEPDRNALCVDGIVKTINKSQLSPDLYQWFSIPAAGVIFIPSVNHQNPDIQFLDTGTFTIYHVVSKKNSCYDTAKEVIKSVRVKAGFSSNDTLNYCAPVNVNFMSSSESADSLVWQFGDGKTRIIKDVPTLSYVYFKNSPTAGFSVKLKAVNNLGCADSVVRTNYIKILGPIPDYTIDIDRGCSPLVINVTDNSSAYSEFYFDYGDGSQYDTTGAPAPHAYTMLNDSNEEVVYYPQLFLIDPLGCLAEYKYINGIEVYAPPQTRHTAAPDSGCTPLEVFFNDSSKFAYTRQWDFDNNNFFDDTGASPVYVYKNPGVYTVRLRVATRHGCVKEDTLYDYIGAYASPVAAFSYNKVDTDSAFVYYDFIDNSSNADELRWYIDSIFTESSPGFKYAFNDTGARRVTLIAKSPEGCYDTLDTTIFVIPDYYFHIPNAFTPNNKGGNETFGMTGPLFAKRFVMNIYNRYGQQVFGTTKVYEQWDGTFKGLPCQQDVYIYNIEYLDMYSHWHVFRGTVTLLR